MKWKEFEKWLMERVVPPESKRGEVFHDVVLLWMIYGITDDFINKDLREIIDKAVKECADILLEQEVEDLGEFDEVGKEE